MAQDAGKAAPPSTEGGNAGTALSGAACPLPPLDGSGSTDQASAKACGIAPNMCGGKRKSRRKSKRRKSRKRRKTKRKSRKRKRRR